MTAVESGQIPEATGHLVGFDPLGSGIDPFPVWKSLLRVQEELQELFEPAREEGFRLVLQRQDSATPAQVVTLQGQRFLLGA